MSILDLFRPKRQEQRAIIEINNSITAFSGTAYASAIFRGAVDSIARHCAKLKAHGIDLDNPNPYMTGYDLLYKTATAYFVSNNH